VNNSSKKVFSVKEIIDSLNNGGRLDLSMLSEEQIQSAISSIEKTKSKADIQSALWEIEKLLLTVLLSTKAAESRFQSLEKEVKEMMVLLRGDPLSNSQQVQEGLLGRIRTLESDFGRAKSAVRYLSWLLVGTLGWIVRELLSKILHF